MFLVKDAILTSESEIPKAKFEELQKLFRPPLKKSKKILLFYICQGILRLLKIYFA